VPSLIALTQGAVVGQLAFEQAARDLNHRHTSPSESRRSSRRHGRRARSRPAET